MDDAYPFAYSRQHYFESDLRFCFGRRRLYLSLGVYGWATGTPDGGKTRPDRGPARSGQAHRKGLFVPCRAAGDCLRRARADWRPISSFGDTEFAVVLHCRPETCGNCGGHARIPAVTDGHFAHVCGLSGDHPGRSGNRAPMELGAGRLLQLWGVGGGAIRFARLGVPACKPVRAECARKLDGRIRSVCLAASMDRRSGAREYRIRRAAGIRASYPGLALEDLFTACGCIPDSALQPVRPLDESRGIWLADR